LQNHLKSNTKTIAHSTKTIATSHTKSIQNTCHNKTFGSLKKRHLFYKIAMPAAGCPFRACKMRAKIKEFHPL
jgi:hypothetical protein